MPCPWRSLVATLLLLAANSAPEVRAHTDADGYETFTRAGVATPLNAYKLYTARAYWDVANAACAREGAHLLVIDSVDEVRLARTLFARVPLDPKLLDQLHVGFTDKAQEGAWKTVLGADLATAGNHVLWATGQPDNAGAAEHCGAITRDVLYNDVPCDKLHQCPYICEKELTSRDSEDVALDEFFEGVDVRHGAVRAKEPGNKSRFLAIMFKLK